MKETETVGLKIEMSVSNGSMLTFVSNNHMASRFVKKDAERGINQFEFLGKSETKTILSGQTVHFKGCDVLSCHSSSLNSFFILNVRKIQEQNTGVERLHFVFGQLCFQTF